MGDIRSGAGQGKRWWEEEGGCRIKRMEARWRKGNTRIRRATQEKQEKRVDRVRGKQGGGKGGLAGCW